MHRCVLLKLWLGSHRVVLSKAIMHSLGIAVKTIEHYPSTKTSPAEVLVRIETEEEIVADEVILRLAGSSRPYNGDPSRVTYAYNLVCENKADHILEQYGIETAAELEEAEGKKRPRDEFENVGMQVCGLARIVNRVANGLAVDILDAIRRMEKAPMDVARLEQENAALRDKAAEVDRLRTELEGVRRDRDDFALECAQLRAEAEAAQITLEGQRSIAAQTLLDLETMAAERDRLRDAQERK